MKLTKRESEMIDLVAEGVGAEIAEVAGMLLERIKRLENTVPAYRGIWKMKTPYARGSICTFSGSMWHSNEDENLDKPGSSEAWTLCCKKGRDARATP